MEDQLASELTRETNDDKKDGGTELANDAISSQQVEIDGGLQLNGDAICSGSSDGGVEHEKHTTKEQGIKIESGAELHHEARSTCNSDGGGTMSENKSTFGQRVKMEGGAELNDEAEGIENKTRSSRLIKTETDKDQVRISDVIHAVFGDSDDKPAQYGVEYGIDQGKNNSISPEHKVYYESDVESEGIVSCEHTQFVPEEEEKAEDKLEGQSICRMLVLEFPKRTPLADPSLMATTELPNIIGFDDKPFDPTTYAEEDFYIIDASGSERLIPPTNIIQWRNVVNLDGTTSVESNGRIVNWSDGSLQLFIGNKAFDVTEEDTKQILSHALLWNEAIYKSLAGVSKSVKVSSSSLVSDPDSLTVLVDQDTTPVPETEQLRQDNSKTTEDNLSLNQKNNDKKVTSNHYLDEFKEHICPSDAEEVNLEGPKDPH